MSQINIFDVEAATGSNSTGVKDGWSTQVITAGKLPEARVDFCLIVIPAPDNSSFNIHMYGGTLSPQCPLSPGVRELLSKTDGR